MVNVLVTGGAGFIGSNFVRYALAAHPDWQRHDARQADLRGPSREPRERQGRSAPPLREGGRRRRGGRRAARQGVRHRRALRGGDPRRPIDQERRRVHHDRRLRHVRAARGGAREPGAAALRADLDRRGLRQRAGGIEHGDRRAAAAQSVLREQGRRRPAGLQLLGDLQGAGRHHPRLQQLRAEPVPREDHPALHHQPDRRHPGAALRRRPERARLAARRRSLPRRGPADRQGRAGRGLQHRRRQRGEERRPHAPDPGAGRQARVAHQARRGPAGPRPPVFARHVEARSRSAGGRGTSSSRGSPRPSPGTSRTSGGGGRSRTRTPEFRKYYQAQYGNRT